MQRLRDVLLVFTCLFSLHGDACAQAIQLLPDAEPASLIVPTFRRNVRAPIPKGKEHVSPLMADDKIADSAPRSVGWIFQWHADFVAKKLTLSDPERELLVRSFKERQAAQARNLGAASYKVVNATTPAEFEEVCALYAENERRDESKLTATLDELFPPAKMRELMMLAIDADRYQFVKVGLIQQGMKLTPNQVDQFSQLGELFLMSLSDHRFKQAQHDPKLALAAAEKVVSIRNLLTQEQFELYAAAVGLIPKDIPLAKHLSECSKQEKEKLMIYKVCRELATTVAD